MTGTWQGLGATLDQAGGTAAFAVFSRNATRIDLYLYATSLGSEENCIYTLAKDDHCIWRVTVPLPSLRERGISGTIFYGYRAWGPNWPHHPCWEKGSAAGFKSDVDDGGNRFNPNKLLIDPYAREISHDPMPRLSSIDPNEYADLFYSGDPWRTIDTGNMAPKGVVVPGAGPGGSGAKPRRHFKDDVIYEVHLRGFTMRDQAIPPQLRGTYLGAARKAGYLKDLGVTAVQFLPVQAFANDQNDDGDPRGDNYWGYMTLGYFAPNRRYACDRSPGGPTREFREMTAAFHDQGIKVFLDVAYNHTGEGVLKRMSETDESRQEDPLQFPECASLLSLRGLDNSSYYQLRSNPLLDGGRMCTRYQDNSGCGGNLKVTEEAVRNLVLDSLRYWSREMGVDGFRFDLAPVLGNVEEKEGFRFDAGEPASILNRAARELPARCEATLEGVDLIAEPWAIGEGTYQLGNFAQQWSEWNDVFRDTMRRAENKLGVEEVTPAQVADAISGSPQQFHRKAMPVPWHSVNYIVCHDGFTLRDLYCYTGLALSWDHGGSRSLQRQAVRNGLTLLMISAGVPMITGGDELFRTLSGRTNTFAQDNESVYLEWQEDLDHAEGAVTEEHLAHRFARNVIGLRRAYGVIRPARYRTGAKSETTGLRDIAWYQRDGREFGIEEWGAPGERYLGARMAAQRPGEVNSLFIGYNWGAEGIEVALPENLPTSRWLRICDTAAWMEPLGNWEWPGTALDHRYYLHGRSIVILLEKV